MFSTLSENCIPFVNMFNFISLFAAELEEPKIGMWGKGLWIGLTHKTVWYEA